MSSGSNPMSNHGANNRPLFAVPHSPQRRQPPIPITQASPSSIMLPEQFAIDAISDALETFDISVFVRPTPPTDPNDSLIIPLPETRPGSLLYGASRNIAFVQTVTNHTSIRSIANRSLNLMRHFQIGGSPYIEDVIPTNLHSFFPNNLTTFQGILECFNGGVWRRSSGIPAAAGGGDGDDDDNGDFDDDDDDEEDDEEDDSEELKAVITIRLKSLREHMKSIANQGNVTIKNLAIVTTFISFLEMTQDSVRIALNISQDDARTVGQAAQTNISGVSILIIIISFLLT